MLQHGEWWLDPQNVLQGEFLHPREHKKLIFTDASNTGWGTHLDHDSQQDVFGLTYQPIGNEGSSSGPAVFQDNLQKQSRFDCLRQHLSGVIHKQTGRHKIHRTLHSNVENPDLVQPQQCQTQSKTCAGVTQCYSRWPLQEESDPTHRVVPISTNLPTEFQDIGESPSGSVCDQPECKTSSVRLSDPRSSGLDSRRPEYPMGKPGHLCFSSHCPTAQGCTKTPITNVQANTYRPRLTNKTVVLGPSGNVTGCTTTTSLDSNLTQTTTEQPLSHQPGFPQPPCLVSRSTVLQKCGFTAEVTERIAAPQRLSTRAIDSSKWSIFQKMARGITGGLQESLYR